MDAPILREQISSRGGGVEISLDHLGEQYEGQKMTAYQNYLGGGMLGSIQNDCTVKGWQADEVLHKQADELSRYLHEQTNPDTEWEGMTFEQRQNMASSAY
jgi:hypothetical protein